MISSARTQYSSGDREPKGRGGLEIDDHLEVVQLLDRQISGAVTLEHALHILGRGSTGLVSVLAIAGKGSSGGAGRITEHRR